MNVVKKAKITHIIASSSLLVLGIVLLCLFPIPLTALRFSVGGVFLLVGASKLFGYFSNDLYKLAFQFDLALGVLSLIVGVVFMLRRTSDYSDFAMVIGIYAIVDALLKLQTAFDAKRFGMSKWLMLLIAAVVVGGAGVLTLMNVIRYPEVQARLMPADFILVGALNIMVTAYTVRVKAKKKNVLAQYEQFMKK